MLAEPVISALPVSQQLQVALCIKLSGFLMWQYFTNVPAQSCMHVLSNQTSAKLNSLQASYNGLLQLKCQTLNKPVPRDSDGNDVDCICTHCSKYPATS